jgi:hypothetical protein
MAVLVMRQFKVTIIDIDFSGDQDIIYVCFSFSKLRYMVDV